MLSNIAILFIKKNFIFKNLMEVKSQVKGHKALKCYQKINKNFSIEK